MGSLFVITVPVRDFEAILRQKEHNLRVINSNSVDRTKVGNYTSKLNDIPSVSSSEAHSISVDEGNSLNSFPEEDNKVDVYTVEANGATVKVVISEDSMAIVDDLGKLMDPPTGNRRKSLSPENQEKEKELKVIDNIFLEKHLEDCLTKFNVIADCWGLTGNGNYNQVTLTVSAEKAEKIIAYLETAGIGKKYNSSLCVCSAILYDELEIGKKDPEKDDIEEKKKFTKWNEFVTSIKSRLTVAQVVQSVKANAILTFDYIVLIIVAGMIAGLGLIDNSVVNVIAAMLVSPLMGPIMASTFGAVIRDWQLARIGITNELIGLGLCLLVGYFFGICLEAPGGKWDGPWSAVKIWPTPEMTARGETRSLAVGVMVAIPSGAGVALSILAGNSGSLVGVAISASLLPPAVNCGILWGLATVLAIRERSGTTSPNFSCTKPLTLNYTRDHSKRYCDNTVMEYFYMGLNSFALTLINIIVIFLVGIVILKIKEVAPYTTRRSLDRFWKKDLKIARHYNSQGKGTGRTLIQELEETGQAKDILNNVETDQTFTSVNGRTGMGVSPYNNILNDVRLRRNFGSMEDIRVTRKVAPTHTPSTTPSGGASGGWFSGWFGGNKPHDSGDEGKDKKRRPKLI